MVQKLSRISVAMLAVGSMLLVAGVCLAQSNPLLPAGVGSGSDLSSWYSHGGTPGLGRGKGPVPQGGDANPAETLLRHMEGTNYGRYTGHAYFQRRPVSEAVRRDRTAGRPSKSDRRGGSKRASNASHGRKARRAGSPRPAARAKLPDPRLFY